MTKEAKDSCWGCGQDYKQQGWTVADFVTVEIAGSKAKLCPDCYEEVKEDYPVVG